MTNATSMKALRKWLADLRGGKSPMEGDRRSGSDRRGGDDRRSALAAPPASEERRSGAERRSGQDRRSS